MSINDYRTGETIRTASAEDVARYAAAGCGDRDTGAIDGAVIAPDLAGLTVWLD